jgi:NADH-quinone oxidoreductase subunit G
VPAASNGRGLREAGVLPGVGPGLSQLDGETARDAHAIAEGLAEGELAALYLLQCDPLRELPDGELWERALSGASTVIAHAAFLTEGVREHATVVFPAEAYPEKEGTIVHPDGRLQRLRPAIARPGSVRAGWQLIAELSLRVGLDLDVLSGAMASKQLFAAVPFYAGLTLEEIGGRGVRWQEREGASAFPASTLGPGDATGATPEPGSALRDAADLAGWRSVWDAQEVEFSPALEFLFPRKNVVLPLSYSGGERA